MANSYKDIADVLNSIGFGVFPVKGQPGKHTVSFVNKDGKRQFIDRTKVTKEDGSVIWKWTVGKELAPVAQTEQASITM